MATEKPTQLDKFKQAARELECDEDEGRWDERLRKVATKARAGEAGVKTISLLSLLAVCACATPAERGVAAHVRHERNSIQAEQRSSTPGRGSMAYELTHSASCDTWTAARSQPGDAASDYQMWVLGFLNGLNWALIEARGDVTGAIDTQTILNWIDGYCRNNPTHSLLSAVLVLDLELVRRAARR